MSSRKRRFLHFCLVVLIGLVLSLPSRVIAQGTAKEKQEVQGKKKELLKDMIERLNPEESERIKEKIEQLRKLTPEEREAMRENPRLLAAIKELEGAIAYLEQASHDFGGHRKKALEASKEAIKQIRKAMAYQAKKEEKKEKKGD